MKNTCRVISTRNPYDEGATFCVQKRFLFFIWQTLIEESEDGDEGPVVFHSLDEAEQAIRDHWGENVVFARSVYKARRIRCGGIWATT